MADIAPRGQRNFLGDFEAMLKAMSLDYIDCARYETSGYAEFIGKLYTMNPSMFQSPIYCDHTLTQMALHYLAWFQDPAVRLEVGPGAAWHVDLDAWKLQRYGGALYVLAAPAESGVRRGERIVAVNGSSLDELYPEVERVLHTTVSPADPEREDWSYVLAFAKHATVEDLQGFRRTVNLVPGESAVTGRMREVYARRSSGEGAGGQADQAAVEGRDADAELTACVRADSLSPDLAGSGDVSGANAAGPAGSDGVAASGAPCELFRHGGTAVLRLADPSGCDFSSALQGCLSELAALCGPDAAEPRPRGLVIDVRGATGGLQDDVYPLVGWVLAPGATAAPIELFGKPGIVLNCSRHNVASKLAELASIRKQLENAAADNADALAELDALVTDLESKRGKGLVADPTDFYPDVTFVSAQAAGAQGPLPVVVLADRDTSDAAEWLVRAAKAAGYARVAGRATRGSLDNTCPRTVRLDADFAVTFPTARYLGASGANATLGRGIAPDVHIPWTPKHLTRDIDLEEAVSLLG